MNAKNVKNDAALMISNPDAMPEFQNWEEEQITLPPYWEVGMDKWFCGLVVSVDDRDEEFVRYLVQAEMPIKCFTGSKKKNEQEEVIVNKGEFFSLSAYASLPLDRYIGVRVLVRVTGRKDIGRPQPMWEFSLKVSPEDKKLLLEDRKMAARNAIRAFKVLKNTVQSPALQATSS